MEDTDEHLADGRREQSTIAFPYLDLDAAVEVAKALYSRAGLGACELDELAAELNQTVSGGFRLKTGTARVFDLIEKEGKSTVKLTELGRKVVQIDEERAARAESFLRVPLYNTVYEKYKGHRLPSARALEKEMASFGVSQKQTDKARQAFERSAKQAGYFDSGEDRLVRPRFEFSTAQIDQPNTPVAEGIGATSDKSGYRPDAYHPFVQGLLAELPASHEFGDWPLNDQAEWLRAAASIFKLLSKTKGRIDVEVRPEKGNADQTSV